MFKTTLTTMMIVGSNALTFPFNEKYDNINSTELEGLILASTVSVPDANAQGSQAFETEAAKQNNLIDLVQVGGVNMTYGLHANVNSTSTGLTARAIEFATRVSKNLSTNLDDNGLEWRNNFYQGFLTTGFYEYYRNSTTTLTIFPDPAGKTTEEYIHQFFITEGGKLLKGLTADAEERVMLERIFTDKNNTGIVPEKTTGGASFLKNRIAGMVSMKENSDRLLFRLFFLRLERTVKDNDNAEMIIKLEQQEFITRIIQGNFTDANVTAMDSVVDQKIAPMESFFLANDTLPAEQSGTRGSNSGNKQVVTVAMLLVGSTFSYLL